MRHISVGLIVILLTLSGACAATIPVYSDGKARIYFAPIDPAELEQWVKSDGPILDGAQGGNGLGAAIADFARCYQGMTGTALPTEAGEGLIPLTLQYQRDLLGELKERGCRIEVSADRIIVTAASRLGLVNGLYTLLDGWGCRWVMPSQIGEVVPTKNALELPAGMVVFQPPGVTTMNSAYGGNGQQNAEWLRRNRSGYDRWMSGQHYYFYALPPEKYFKDHPEYYALIGGQRKATQLCTTNPQVIELVTEDARQFLRKHPAAVSYPMDPEDNYDFCQCDRCTALDPPGQWQGQPLLTDRVIAFANEVAGRIEKEFPDRVVALYAYQSHQQPPVRIKPLPNVYVIICRANYCYVHLTPTDFCHDLAAYETMVDGWGKVCDHLFAYEYNPIYWTAQLPCPIYLEQAKTVRRQQAQKIYDRHEDASYPGSTSNYLDHYMTLRMMNDLKLDADKELSDLCNAFFGPAGGAMGRYYLSLARVSEYTHPDTGRVGGGLEGYDRMFSDSLMAESRLAINQAMETAGLEGVFQSRVKMVETTQRYLEAYLQGIHQAQAGHYEKSVEGFDRADALLDEMGVVEYLATDGHIRLKTARLKTIAEYFPDRLGFVRTWRIIGPFDNDKRDALVLHEDFEADAKPTLMGELSDHAGRKARWRTYASSGGFVSFEKAFEKDQRPWRFSTAYAGVRINNKQARTVQFRMDSFNGFRVYLNGKQVYERPGLDADSPDKRIVNVELPAGQSTILIKVGKSFEGAGFHWGFYFRITDANGQSINGLQYSP
jgi:hypothetical protein